MSEEIEQPGTVDIDPRPPREYVFQETTLAAVADFVARMKEAGQPVTTKALRGFVVLKEGLPPYPKQMPAFEAAIEELISA